MRRYDIAVIGGGAAGLSAAISAKRADRKASAAVIERLPKVGKKILATGNGRCNLSNADLSAAHYYGSCKELLRTTADFSVTDFFESLGVICDDDGYGRIYPRCRSAASVLDALRLECAKLGVEEICGINVTGIAPDRSGYIIHTADGDILSRSVILAGGGRSQSALGSNGSMLEICKKLGLPVHETFPALVPLKTDPALVKPLKGQRIYANVEYWCSTDTAKKKYCAGSERGEVQFTDGLVSGICVFDLSYLYGLYGNGELRLDLLPDMSSREVTELLEKIQDIRKTASPEDLLSGIFTRPVGIYVLKRALRKFPAAAEDITGRDRESIVRTIKSLTFPVTGTAGFERSQVTGGGVGFFADVTNEQVVTQRFEVVKYPGMYVCGELLDIYGKCGGYNLDFAFSSGALAGKSAASDLYMR